MRERRKQKEESVYDDDKQLGNVLRVFVFFLVLMLLLFLIGYCWPAYAQKNRVTKDDIKSAMTWLMTDVYEREQKNLGVRWGIHPLLKKRNEKKIYEISEAVLLGSTSHGVDVPLILTVSWRESRFEPRVFVLKKRGEARHEMGLMQVHGAAARGCDLSTIQGQVMCGTSWLRLCINKCRGSIKGGLTLYATGRTCRATPGSSLDRKMTHRYKLWRRISDKINGRQ